MRLLFDDFVMRELSICVTIWAVLSISRAISTKLDFEGDAVSNTSNADEDVEVKHTIIVSTKLKNNNRRGLQSDDDSGTLTYNIGRKEKPNEDSGEIPVYKGYKAVDSTKIWTPDTRNKAKPLETFVQTFPDVFINRNIRDHDDVFPSIEINPSHWQPSNFYNNINNWGQQPPRESNFESNLVKFDRPNQAKFHRKITEDGTKEFYCRKCRELSCHVSNDHYIPLSQPWSWVSRTTTPKIKIDGKLAKLN